MRSLILAPIALCAILAAPAADALVADCDQLDLGATETLLAPDLFCPGILRMGGFETAAVLAAPHPLLLHNTVSHFPNERLVMAYKSAGEGEKLRIESSKLSEEEIARWITALR